MNDKQTDLKTENTDLKKTNKRLQKENKRQEKDLSELAILISLKKSTRICTRTTGAISATNFARGDSRVY